MAADVGDRMAKTAKPDRGALGHVFYAGLAFFCVFLALLNNFIRFQKYPILRIEVLYAVLFIGIAASVYATLYYVASRLPRWPRRIFQGIMVAGLAGYAVALVSSLIYAAAVTLAAAALFTLFDVRILPPIAFMALATLLTASLGIGQQSESEFKETGHVRRSSSSGPAILHVILDEHIGVQGFPAGNPSSPKIEKYLRGFYLWRNFRLFGGAYSSNSKTIRSIPLILNFGASEANNAMHNAYFDRLIQGGYVINVLQSDYINYCSDRVAVCTTYQSQNYTPIADAQLPPIDKAILIIRKMVPNRLADLLRGGILRLNDAGLQLPLPWVTLDLNPTPMNGLAALRRLKSKVSRIRPGEVYFAHILLPHGPYTLNSDCSVSRVSQWMLGDRGQPLSQRQDAYVRQVQCTIKELGLLLDAVDHSPAAGNVIVIIHGDHGSRISDIAPNFQNIGKFDDESLIAGFSTLFAVRAPEVHGGYDSRHFAVASLVHELAVSGFRKVGSREDSDPKVMLLDQNLIPRKNQPLPKHW